MKDIYILDAVHTLFRSYFGIGRMTNKSGQSTNALYGFIRTFQKLVKDFDPQHVVAVFDGPDNKKSRTAIYKEYKSHRTGMPEDLFPQLDLAKEYCEAAGIPVLTEPGVEADDVIGCVAKWAEKKGAKVYICSSDKDLCQLISERIFLLKTYKNNLLVDREMVKELYGITPEQIIDYLAITGDKSDNIPGIPGLGPKAASDLLNAYGNLENIYKHADEVKGKRGENLITYKDDAFLSQKLATLHLDIKVPTKEDFYELSGADEETLHSLYKEMNFASLLKEREPKKDIALESSCHLVDDKTSLSALVKKLEAAEEFAFDTETTQLSPMEAELVGMGFAIKASEPYYVPLNGKLGDEAVLNALGPVLKKSSIYGHNIKYDLHILENYGINVKEITFDTMLASYILNPQNSRHGLDQVVLEQFGKHKTGIKSLIGSGKKEKSMRDVDINKVADYCCEDVTFTCRLKEVFEAELKRRHLDNLLYDIELPLVPILLEMERHGIFLDAEKLKIKSKELTEKVKKLEKEIHKLAEEEFNINSPKQLSHVLYTHLKIKRPEKARGTALGTGAEILNALKKEYPIAGKVLEYRTLEKLRSTYVDSLPKQVNESTRRVHCSFNQSVAATGRLSCTDPNLQNIPVRSSEGRKIREAFHPEKKGWSFLSADYSQVELRLLAHLSEDETLVKAFKDKQDIHAFTASKIFDISLDKVTKEMRHRAKAVNFGLIYGQSAFGLSQELGIPQKEATAFIKKYFERYPRVKKFLDSCKEEARESGMATTMTGRERPIPEIKSSNYAVRALGDRLAINTPFQGTSADIIKLAMIDIDKKLKKEKMEAFMILQIHDELIFETPDSEVAHLKSLVKESMEEVMTLKVPLTVDISVGKNWGEC